MPRQRRGALVLAVLFGLIGAVVVLAHLARGVHLENWAGGFALGCLIFAGLAWDSPTVDGWVKAAIAAAKDWFPWSRRSPPQI